MVFSLVVSNLPLRSFRTGRAWQTRLQELRGKAAEHREKIRLGERENSKMDKLLQDWKRQVLGKFWVCSYGIYFFLMKLFFFFFNELFGRKTRFMIVMVQPFFDFLEKNDSSLLPAFVCYNYIFSCQRAI